MQQNLSLATLAQRASQVALVVRNSPPNAGDTGDVGSIPGSGSSPGGGNGNPLHYSLKTPMGRGAWQTTAHGVARVRLNHHHLCCLDAGT